MTIDELKSNLKKISPQLKLDVDLNEPMGVWYESDDSSEDDLELFRIDENDFYFEPIINEIYEANLLIGSDTVKEVGDLLFKYFEPKLSKESQKISKNSKNGNGSTAAFSKFASKDSQKKPKAQLIYDFIDEIVDHGFDTEQTVINHKTGYIKVSYKFDDSIRVDCLAIYLLDLGIDKIPDNPIYLNKDLCMQLDEQKLMKLNWLFERVSKFVSDLREK